MFVANKFPQRLDGSGWVSLLPPRTPNAPLKNDITVDVVIVGAGFAGLSAAKQLSIYSPNLTVAILDAGVLAQGAAGRNSGFIIDLPHEVSSDDYSGQGSSQRKHDIKVHRTAIALATQLAEEMGWGKEVFNPCGKYNVAMSSKGDEHVTSYARQLDSIHEPYTLLNGKEIAEVTGTTSFTSAIYTPGTVMIQPAAYVRGLAESLPATFTLYENTPAVSFDSTPKGCLVKTPNGSISAAKMILATNGHAQSFGLFPGKLLHIYTYASMTEPFDPKRLGGDRSWAATPAFPMGTTVRRVEGKDGDRILVRSRYSYNPRLQVSNGEIARAGKVHDKKYAARFPMLPDLKMQYRWGGAMALTWNGVPIFGEVAPNIIAAVACNGVGATKASAAGIAAADAVLGNNSDLFKIFSSYEAAKNLPPQPFLSIGVSANLGFKEWAAGLE